jgi:hypothetical protein
MINLFSFFLGRYAFVLADGGATHIVGRLIGFSEPVSKPCYKPGVVGLGISCWSLHNPELASGSVQGRGKP